MVLADAVMVPAALWSSFALKHDSLRPPLGEAASLFLVAIVTTIPLFSWLGLYRAIVRFLGPRAMYAVAGGVTISAGLLAIYDFISPVADVPASVLITYWALALLYAGGSRLVMRHVFLSQLGREGERVVIYGAGDAGARLCTVLFGSNDCRPVAFVDDKAALQGSFINGIEVFSPQVLPGLVKDR